MDINKNDKLKKDIDLLITNVLSENGQPYSWFKYRQGIRDQYMVDWDNLEIHFSPYVGPSKDVEAITHELGHLMIARDEGIGKQSWGLENPYVIMSRFGFDFFPKPDNTPQVRMEAKAWAWQYLIEVMAGLKDLKDPLPLHPEAQFLTDFTSNNIFNPEMVENIFKDELSKIMKKDWREIIKYRFSNMKNILSTNKNYLYDYEKDNGQETILRMFSQKAGPGNKDTHIIKLADIGQGYYTTTLEVNVVFDQPFEHDETLYRLLTRTRSLQRAERFFDIALSINDQNLYEQISNENDVDKTVPEPSA